MNQKKYLNRYKSFLCSLSSLAEARKRDLTDDFVISGTVQKFCLTFDISWKVMKDILIKQLGILDFAIGSPRETLHQSFTNKIIDDDRWLQMLRARNQLAHDYDGTFAAEKFQDIINVYYPLFEKLKDNVKKYYITEQVVYRKQARVISNVL